MKKEVITTAKTIEEAVALAVRELGAPDAEKIEYTVLEEAKKGFLGIGASDAKIRATYVLGGEYEALDFINKLLDAINFRHVYADASGAIRLSRIQNKTSPDFVYRSGKQFIIIPPIKLNKDIYDLPNVVVGVWSSPDSNTPVVYTKRNDDMNSVISTVNRGYEVVKMLNVYNIASSNEMKDYVDRIAFESMQATESVTFETAIEAGHEPGTALQVDAEDIDGLFIENQWTMRVSQTAFRMQHTAERKVFV